jgi:hypothetical protein
MKYIKKYEGFGGVRIGGIIKTELIYTLNTKAQSSFQK